MRAPKNFYNAVDKKKLGLDDGLLPEVTTSDAGKVLKVTEGGKWDLADDENTIIVANPEEQPTIDLEKLQIGSTVYSVKNPELTSIKSFKLTMSNGGQYNTSKPIIEFYNEGGQKASITSSDYAVECDKTYSGNAGMDQVCSILTPDTPGTFTYTFVNDFDIDTYKLIKLTRGGTFLDDVAKNIKLELSANGEDYITIYDETTITWSDAVPYHLIDLKTGEEASTLLPIVSSADNGRVLVVENGVWGKGEITTGGVIGERNNPITVYCANIDGNGIPSFDIQSHTEFRPDRTYYIDTTNLKVMLIVNSILVAFNKPISEVFDLDVSKPQIGTEGGVNFSGKLTATYAALIPNVQRYDLGYFRFMSDITVGNPKP